MPPPTPKHLNCVLCNKRTKPKSRRHVNKNIQRFLRKSFFLEAIIGDVICNTCKHKYYSRSTIKPQNVPKQTSATPRNNVLSISSEPTPTSPPSINLPIPTMSKSHSYCCICKRPGPKLVVVSSECRFNVFLRYNILVSAGSRCCPVHINDGEFVNGAINDLKRSQSSENVLVNRSTLLDIISKLRKVALENESGRINFDKTSNLSDSDYVNLTGLQKGDFEIICDAASNKIRNTPVRSVRTSVGIFLLKMKSAISNRILATIFNITKSSVRRAVSSVRSALMIDFVPSNLGFQHISRTDIIEKHTRPLAHHLFGNIANPPAIIVLDGTFIYIQKSENFQFQRRTYSMHKGRPLVKPMVVVSTSGYYISIFGPYLADSKNNDASILQHMITKNVDSIKEWIQEDDIFVVDRGFRDSLDLLEDLGIKAKMPSFMRKGQKQMPTEEANVNRLVTKIRWVVESANARIKKWRYLANILPTNQVPFIGDYVRIICAICNRFLPPLSKGSTEDDQTLAAKMLYLSSQVNTLKTYVENQGLLRRSAKWQAVDEVENFPHLDEEELRNLTCGTYQLKLSSSYIQEHIDGDSDIFIHKDEHDLLRVKIQSRHISSKQYILWLRFTPITIVSWYCTCRAGARVVGTCSHVAAIVWYLGYAKHTTNSYGVRKWSDYVEDATLVDDSDSDVVEE